MSQTQRASFHSSRRSDRSNSPGFTSKISLWIPKGKFCKGEATASPPAKKRLNTTRKGDVVFDTDEHVKPETTMETLAKMKAVFKKEGGSVTAGNASGINDGAAFFVLADAETAKKAGQKPIARLVSYAIAGVPNHIMGEGPIPATKIALERAGLKLDQIDVIESNEAFAAQALAVTKGLGLDPAKTNVNGGAIALGHPIGCSGAAIATKAIHELQRVQGRYALVTMCIGGGQGIATIFERL